MPFIYKISSLKTRFSHHKSIANRCRSRIIIDCGDAEITLLEECSKEEMSKCEYKYFKIFNVVNLCGTINYNSCDKKTYDRSRIRSMCICEICGLELPKKNKLRHERSKKHLSKISILN